MKVHVLFAQRKCSHPGQYGLEALTCMSEYEYSDNPGYMSVQKAEYEASNEFEKVSELVLEVDEQTILSAMFPERVSIPASVSTVD